MILKSGILTLQSLMETGVLLLDDSALGHPRNGGPGIIIIIAHPIPPLLLLPSLLLRNLVPTYLLLLTLHCWTLKAKLLFPVLR